MAAQMGLEIWFGHGKCAPQCLHQAIDKGGQGGPVRRSVVGVEFSDREGADPLIAQQSGKGAEGNGLAEPVIAPGVLGERCVGEIDRVHIEVDQEPITAGIEMGEGASSGGLRLARYLRDSSPSSGWPATTPTSIVQSPPRTRAI